MGEQCVCSRGEEGGERHLPPARGPLAGRPPRRQLQTQRRSAARVQRLAERRARAPVVAAPWPPVRLLCRPAGGARGVAVREGEREAAGGVLRRRGVAAEHGRGQGELRLEDAALGEAEVAVQLHQRGEGRGGGEVDGLRVVHREGRREEAACSLVRRSFASALVQRGGACSGAGRATHRRSFGGSLRPQRRRSRPHFAAWRTAGGAARVGRRASAASRGEARGDLSARLCRPARGAAPRRRRPAKLAIRSSSGGAPPPRAPPRSPRRAGRPRGPRRARSRAAPSPPAPHPPPSRGGSSSAPRAVPRRASPPPARRARRRCPPCRRTSAATRSPPPAPPTASPTGRTTLRRAPPRLARATRPTGGSRAPPRRAASARAYRGECRAPRRGPLDMPTPVQPPPRTAPAPRGRCQTSAGCSSSRASAASRARRTGAARRAAGRSCPTSSAAACAQPRR